jgi:hypothetical protein
LDFVSARYYTAYGITTFSTATIGINNTRYLPFYVSKTTTFDRISILTGATFSGTSLVRLGIYQSTNGLPDTVVLDAGTVAPNSSNGNFAITINQTLNKGWYFLANNSITAATVNNYMSASGSLTSTVGTTTPGTTINNGYSQTANVTSGFSTAASLSLSSSTNITWIRKA